MRFFILTALLCATTILAATTKLSERSGRTDTVGDGTPFSVLSNSGDSDPSYNATQTAGNNTSLLTEQKGTPTLADTEADPKTGERALLSINKDNGYVDSTADADLEVAMRKKRELRRRNRRKKNVKKKATKTVKKKVTKTVKKKVKKTVKKKAKKIQKHRKRRSTSASRRRRRKYYGLPKPIKGRRRAKKPKKPYTGRGPKTCPCYRVAKRAKECYSFTNENKGYCKLRFCEAKWECVTSGRSRHICIRKFAKDTIEPLPGSYSGYKKCTRRSHPPKPYWVFYRRIRGPVKPKPNNP